MLSRSKEKNEENKNDQDMEFMSVRNVLRNGSLSPAMLAHHLLPLLLLRGPGIGGPGYCTFSGQALASYGKGRHIEHLFAWVS